MQKSINFTDENNNYILEYIKNQIDNININNLTPLEALNLMKEMKDQIEEKK